MQIKVKKKRTQGLKRQWCKLGWCSQMATVPFHQSAPDPCRSEPTQWFTNDTPIIPQCDRNGTTTWRNDTSKPSVTETPVCVPNAQWGQTTPKRQSLEQRKVYCSATQGDGWLKPRQTPKSLGTLSKALFQGRGGRGEWVVANILVAEPVFLRSGHSQGMMLLQTSTKWILFSVLTRKDTVPRENRHPLRSSPGWEAQISAGGSLRARSPDPVQPSSLRKTGMRDATSAQAPQAACLAGEGRAGSADGDPGRRPLPWGHRGGGEGHLKAWAWPVGGSWWGLWRLQDTAPNLFPGPLSSSADLRPDELEGPWERPRIRLLPHSPAWRPPLQWPFAEPGR